MGFGSARGFAQVETKQLKIAVAVAEDHSGGGLEATPGGLTLTMLDIAILNLELTSGGYAATPSGLTVPTPAISAVAAVV